MISIYDIRDFFKGMLITFLIILSLVFIAMLLALPMILALLVHWTFIFLYLIPLFIIVELIRRRIVDGYVY